MRQRSKLSVLCVFGFRDGSVFMAVEADWEASLAKLLGFSRVCGLREGIEVEIDAAAAYIRRR